jgi:hypothetical protein
MQGTAYQKKSKNQRRDAIMKIGNIAEQEAGQHVQVYSQIGKAKRTPRQTSIMAHVAINPVRKW